MFDHYKLRLMRSGAEHLSALYWRGKAPATVLSRDLQIEAQACAIPMRIYTPPGEGPFAVILYFHGGGFVLGSIDTHDGVCRSIAMHCDCIVVSVGYRLAPEYPFPAAVEDSYSALLWLQRHAEDINARPDSLVLAGDSAGGNLAAVTAIQARNKLPGLVRGQALFYPVTDHYDPGTESYFENAKGPLLTRKTMIFFWDHYLRNSPLLPVEEFRHALATPLCHEDLSGLPPSFVLTAERDPLRDEGEAYAERLRASGVKVLHSEYIKAAHGFMGAMGPSRHFSRGLAELARWLKTLD